MALRRSEYCSAKGAVGAAKPPPPGPVCAVDVGVAASPAAMAVVGGATRNWNRSLCGMVPMVRGAFSSRSKCTPSTTTFSCKKEERRVGGS